MCRRIPSLNWLRVFEAAARAESFARAAEALAMSPPAVSQQIRALEDHLGSQLFLRHPRHVELTDAGRAFLPSVRQALSQVETTAQALFSSDGTETITVQAVSLLALGWLPPRIAQFEAQNPGLNISLISGNNLPDFRRVMPVRGPDVQIIFGGAAEVPHGAEMWLPEQLRIVARPDLAAAIDRPEDLSGCRLFDVASHDSGWPRMLAAFAQADIVGTVTSFVDSTPMAFALAAEGLGFALERAPASDVLRKAYGLVPVPISPVLRGTEHYFVVVPARRGGNRGGRRFRDWLFENTPSQDRSSHDRPA